jgi:hypothetical protein
MTWSHLGSGAVQSGNIASEHIGGSHVASGRLGWNTLGSGTVQSGHISSGSVGQNHVGWDQLTGVWYPIKSYVVNGNVSGYIISGGMEACVFLKLIYTVRNWGSATDRKLLARCNGFSGAAYHYSDGAAWVTNSGNQMCVCEVLRSGTTYTTGELVINNTSGQPKCGTSVYAAHRAGVATYSRKIATEWASTSGGIQGMQLWIETDGYIMSGSVIKVLGMK